MARGKDRKSFSLLVVRPNLEVSKKSAKLAKSVKENSLIIYAPLWWREVRAPKF